MSSSNRQVPSSAHNGDRLATRSAVAFVVSAAVILCCPTPQQMTPEAFRLIAVVVLMAGLWVTQVIPLAATSLLPLVLFPIFGIQPAKIVSSTYVNDLVFLYLGGFIIALGIERWGLHTRIALHIVRLVGVSPRRVVLGFMLATAGMSMWISNTASTLLMLPIGLALLKTLDVPLDLESERKSNSASNSPRTLQDALAVPLLLGIAYSASLGGMTSITGTPTNYQAVGVYEEMFPDSPKLTVATWLMACLPIGVIYLGLAWTVLTWKLPSASCGQQETKRQLRNRLTGLGAPSSAEIKMMVIFAMTAALWVFRSSLQFGTTKLISGWSEWLPQWFELLGTSEVASSYSGHINDSTISMLMAFALFCIPSGTRDSSGRSVRLMNWETASRLPWDVVLLVGSGFALASAFGTTGLSEWVGLFLQQHLQQFPIWLIVACVCLMMTFLTEFTSNVATVSTLMPTLAALCIALDVDPRLLMVPAALATSCAFMLPIATPPNAIVFGSGRISVKEMVRYGVILNLIGVPVLTAATWLVIKPVLGIP